MRKIILAEGQPPKLEGEWTVGEILAAAEFLRRWIEQQKLGQPPPPAEQQ